MLCSRHLDILNVGLDGAMFADEEKPKMRYGFSKANRLHLRRNIPCEICKVPKNANGLSMVGAIQDLLRRIASMTPDIKPQISERKRKHLEAF
jgi:hypothetical protein